MSIILREKLIAHKQIRKIVKLIFEKSRPLLLAISPKLGYKYIYYMSTGRRLNLKNPETYDEKIQWLKLHVYRNNPLATQCADKYAVRKYVIEKGLGKLLNELYAVYDRVEDIDWDGLPDSFVLKTTHGSGGNVICNSKISLDIPAAVKKLSDSINTDYSRISGELHYANIPRRIVAEKYLRDGNRRLPRDYRIYCCQGKAKGVWVVSYGDTAIKADFLTLEWERIGFGQEKFESETIPEKPENFKEICEYAEILSAPFPFVRMDFYNIDNKQPVFGEMTFTPLGGFSFPYNENKQKYLGQLIELNKTDA